MFIKHWARLQQREVFTRSASARFSCRASTMDEVSKLRVQYSNTALSEADVDAAGTPLRLFHRWFEEAVRVVSHEPNAMTLATATPEGIPSARMVLLKGYDPEKGSFTWYTNYNSRKAQELDRNPHAALVFWWPELERCVRIEGIVERLSAVESDAYFVSRPLGSRLGAWASAQSQPIVSREDLERQAAEVAKRFASTDVPRPPNWGGYILYASRIEFWKGRANRLHDRLLFERQTDVNGAGASWSMIRLQP
ncbi:hypothetical protein F1559_002424 [Cyanidiococcus yangmingshanensis]|uniref:Pyridoxine-5'-phosphate oxidase n=1 Tax=Cyanidiococcus yangmingshanensis TaxID=2690220 RepID=A0A7J7IIU4_9RHOD|nr:hypothetical protein F1559_002424 [Cyanidiococcus yangmingshanensis]